MKIELSDRELAFLALLCDKQAERVYGEGNREEIEELARRFRAARTPSPAFPAAKQLN